MMIYHVHSKDKLYCLEGVKGIGAFIIAFLWHYQHFAPQNGSPFYDVFSLFYDHGYLMVEIFFVLSGFGMVLGYEEKIRSNSFPFWQYLKRRLLKLFPLMLLTLIVTAVLQAVYLYRTGYTFVYSNYDIYHFLLNGFGLQNGILETAWSFNAPSWCISVLVWCYIVFYAVCRSKCCEEMLVFRYAMMALIGLGVIAAGVNYPVINSEIGRALGGFFVGAILAKVYQWREKIYAVRLGYLGIVFLLIVAVLLNLYGSVVWGNASMATILGVGPACIVSVLFVPWLNRLCSFRPLVYLGKLSLGIYLWHFPVQCVWRIVEVFAEIQIDYSRNIVWSCYVISTILVAATYDRFWAVKINNIHKLFIND